MQRWFYSKGGKTLGPVSPTQLRDLARQGHIDVNDLVQREGSDKWVAAGSLSGLFDQPAATGVTAAAPRPKSGTTTAHAPIPVARKSQSSSPLVRAILALPKPVLFGLCGALGGLLGALFFGELLFWLLRPRAVEAKEPAVLMAAPNSVRVYVGGENRVRVQVARQGFKGPILLQARDASPEVTGSQIAVAEDKDSADLVVRVAKTAKPGKYVVPIVGQPPSDAPEKTKLGDEKIEVVVEPVPASVQLAVPPKIVVLTGGKTKFTAKIARTNFEADVTLQFKGGPADVPLPTVIIPAGKDSQEIEIEAPRTAPPGARDVSAEVVAVLADRPIRKTSTFRLEVKPAPVPKADIVFVVDLTGSMQFAINGIKNGIHSFIEKLGGKDLDARVAVVVFRDIVADREEPYALKFDGEVFTKNFEAIRSALNGRALQARGGGDLPESSLQALALTAKQPFRDDASRVVVLITDAEPKKNTGHPNDIPEATEELKKAKINQVHLFVRPPHLDIYRPLQKGAKGSYIDIDTLKRGDAFAEILPKLGEEISRITIASLPNAPSSSAPPPLLPSADAPPLPPATSDATVKAVSSTDAYAESDRFRLLLAIAVWTAVIAAGISFVILAGQEFYLRQALLGVGAAALAIGGGVFAGLVGGAAGQLIVQASPEGALWEGLSRVLGWGLLGAIAGAGMAVMVPNLKWYRSGLGGLVGGILGALGFLAISYVLGGLLGRVVGTVILGFFIGLMVALAELAFRRYWLEVTFGQREVRTVTLGSAAVSVGGDERAASVYVAGAAPVALRYRMDHAGRVLCEDATTGEEIEVSPGDRKRVGNVTVTVCSPANVRGSGYALELDSGATIPLSDGMPLTQADLPGVEPQTAGAEVALVSKRPNNPNALLLRNRSKQTWTTRTPDGKTEQIPPGRGVELTDGLTVDFGPVRGTLSAAATAAAAR